VKSEQPYRGRMMTRDQMTQFTYLHNSLRLAVEGLPSFTDNPEAYREAMREITKLNNELVRLNPPNVQPLK
jgi:uncharacterized protein YjeT (DUF2065 family)